MPPCQPYTCTLGTLGRPPANFACASPCPAMHSSLLEGTVFGTVLHRAWTASMDGSGARLLAAGPAHAESSRGAAAAPPVVQRGCFFCCCMAAAYLLQERARGAEVRHGIGMLICTRAVLIVDRGTCTGCVRSLGPGAQLRRRHARAMRCGPSEAPRLTGRRGCRSRGCSGGCKGHGKGGCVGAERLAAPALCLLLDARPTPREPPASQACSQRVSRTGRRRRLTAWAARGCGGP